MLDIDVSGSSDGFNKAQFLNYSLGEHRIRLLENPRRIFLHYFRGKGTIECLGSDCPICQRNKIIAASTGDPTKDPAYNKPSLRFYFNGVDRSMVKICPNCQEENKESQAGFLPVCSECGAIITDVGSHPVDKVKVINVSRTNAEKLRSFQAGILDANKEPIGLENYDVLFKVYMTGKVKNIDPEPDPSANDALEVPEDALYDLEKVTVKLEPDEIESFLKGVSLKDIFIDVVEETIEELTEDIEKSLAKVFDN